MRLVNILISTASAVGVVSAGGLLFPHLFADRVTDPLMLSGRPLFGLPSAAVPGVVAQIGAEVSQERIPIEFRSQQHTMTLEKLGIAVDVPATVKNLKSKSARLQFRLDQETARQEMEAAFRSVIRPPKNASLAIISPKNIPLVKGQPGEAVDSVALIAALQDYLVKRRGSVSLRIIAAEPRVQDAEVASARALTESLLERGLKLSFEDRVFEIKNQELLRLVEFVEQVDPQKLDNYILGVRLNPEHLRQSLEKVAEEVNQEPVNAKFEIRDGLVIQFAAPERGLELNLDASAENIARVITTGEAAADLAVAVKQPEIAKQADMENLGLTSVLAVGESDFASSPRNRIHNITIGAARYHGLLIAPGEEFSFNKHLGPVNAAAGFKPELVIKKNVTTPEFGGGLCQVSTTAFRAALKAGLKITARRAHAYAVRYYGAPGFDATIYPGYTDLRFQNNTPGHILVQTKIEGTQLLFTFYGTADGRSVEIDGPHPYSRQASGAVKATVTQRVFKDSQTILDETFHSNYRSPALFPRT